MIKPVEKALPDFFKIQYVLYNKLVKTYFYQIVSWTIYSIFVSSQLIFFLQNA